MKLAKLKYICGLIILLNVPFTAWAKLNVVTTLPNFAYLATQIGGDQVAVKAMLGTGLDPHFIDAKPTFIIMLNKADFLISNGLELEAGYLPLLIDQARNAKLRPGEPGSLILGDKVPVLDIATGKVSRAMGDVHPSGNPHFYLSPVNVPIMAKAIAEKLIDLDAEHKSIYQANLQIFLASFQGKLSSWKSAMSKLGPVKAISYHKSMDYLLEWLGWAEIDTIEPKPGIPPSTSRLAELAEKAKSSGVQILIAESWYPSKDGKFISEKTGIPLAVIDGLTNDYVAYFDGLFEKLSQVAH